MDPFASSKKISAYASFSTLDFIKQLGEGKYNCVPDDIKEVNELLLKNRNSIEYDTMINFMNFSSRLTEHEAITLNPAYKEKLNDLEKSMDEIMQYYEIDNETIDEPEQVFFYNSGKTSPTKEHINYIKQRMCKEKLFDLSTILSGLKRSEDDTNKQIVSQQICIGKSDNVKVYEGNEANEGSSHNNSRKLKTPKRSIKVGQKANKPMSNLQMSSAHSISNIEKKKHTRNEDHTGSSNNNTTKLKIQKRSIKVGQKENKSMSNLEKSPDHSIPNIEKKKHKRNEDHTDDILEVPQKKSTININTQKPIHVKALRQINNQSNNVKRNFMVEPKSSNKNTKIPRSTNTQGKENKILNLEESLLYFHDLPNSSTPIKKNTNEHKNYLDKLNNERENTNYITTSKSIIENNEERTKKPRNEKAVSVESKQVVAENTKKTHGRPKMVVSSNKNHITVSNKSKQVFSEITKNSLGRPKLIVSSNKDHITGSKSLIENIDENIKKVINEKAVAEESKKTRGRPTMVISSNKDHITGSKSIIEDNIVKTKKSREDTTEKEELRKDVPQKTKKSLGRPKKIVSPNKNLITGSESITENKDEKNKKPRKDESMKVVLEKTNKTRGRPKKVVSPNKKLNTDNKSITENDQEIIKQCGNKNLVVNILQNLTICKPSELLEIETYQETPKKCRGRPRKSFPDQKTLPENLKTDDKSKDNITTIVKSDNTITQNDINDPFQMKKVNVLLSRMTFKKANKNLTSKEKTQLNRSSDLEKSFLTNKTQNKRIEKEGLSKTLINKTLNKSIKKQRLSKTVKALTNIKKKNPNVLLNQLVHILTYSKKRPSKKQSTVNNDKDESINGKTGIADISNVLEDTVARKRRILFSQADYLQSPEFLEFSRNISY